MVQGHNRSRKDPTEARTMSSSLFTVLNAFGLRIYPRFMMTVETVIVIITLFCTFRQVKIAFAAAAQAGHVGKHLPESVPVMTVSSILTVGVVNTAVQEKNSR